MSSLSVERLRSDVRQRAAHRPAGPDLHRVLDLQIPDSSCRARLYQPSPAATNVVLFLHGGGWTMGDLETHDRACRRFAAASQLTVLALAYRLAPEHPYPAALDDTVAALHFLGSTAAPAALGFTPGAFGVAGESAGGTLAALATLRLRAASAALPAAMLLLYANTDLSGSGESMREKAQGFGLNAADVEWFNLQWSQIARAGRIRT
jgi:acetyl esterase